MKKIAFVLVLAFIMAMSIAYAHSGGTDKFGCHTDHKTGFYHCH